MLFRSVVGIGSTAAQVVPALAKIAGQVTIFAREPAYVRPKDERFLTQSERKRFGDRWGRLWERARLFWQIERGMSVRNPKSRSQQNARDAFLKYRDAVFHRRPDLVAKLTPSYLYACKRPVASSDFFPSLTRENVQVVARSVVSVTPNGVVDSDGVQHDADVLVMATGFQPWNFLAGLNLVGRGGRRIHGVWGDEPEAFLGIQVSGFPNFFMMYGPNTNYFCVTFMLERQAEYIARALKRLISNRASSIDVRRGAMDLYNRWVDRALSQKTLEGACNNYYHSAAGRNVVTWPWRGTVYVVATKLGLLACVTRQVGKNVLRTRFEPNRSTLAKPRSPTEASSAAAEGADAENV